MAKQILREMSGSIQIVRKAPSGAIIGMVLLILILWLTMPQPVQADVAPPEKPPGANPVPGSEVTQVRMQSETVVMVIKPASPENNLGHANVDAIFNMRNLGSVEERMDVRFPLSFFNGESDGFGNYPEIADLRARIDGNYVNVRRVVIPGKDGVDIPWAAFGVVFPPGKDVQIEVTYTAQGYGVMPNVAYKYILETGAGWKDTIGSADLVVRLPYEANNLNVFLDETTGYSMTSPNFSITGNELRWHYDNLEPTAANNLQVSLVVPQAWQAVLKEKAAVLQNPKDGEAWGRLGKAYKEIVKLKRGLRQDAGGLELYQLSLEAYTKSLSFLPKDGLWHLGLADLLWNHYYWHVYWPGNPDPSELVRTVQELKLSLEFAPKNQKALDLLLEINQSVPGVLQSMDDGSYNYLILTGTPAVTLPYVPTTATATATVTASPVPMVVPSSTLTPELTADILIKPTAVPTQEQEATPVETTPQKTPARSPTLPVCGGGLMIPLGAAAAAIRAKMRLKGSAKNI